MLITPDGNYDDHRMTVQDIADTLDARIVEQVSPRVDAPPVAPEIQASIESYEEFRAIENAEMVRILNDVLDKLEESRDTPEGRI